MTEIDTKILNELQEQSDGLATTEIASRIDAPRSTVFEHLQALEEENRVESWKPHQAKRVWAIPDGTAGVDSKPEGATFRKKRERANLTQFEVASEVPIHQSTVSNWERGKAELDEEIKQQLWQVVEPESIEGETETVSVWVQKDGLREVDIEIPAGADQESYIKSYVAGL